MAQLFNVRLFGRAPAVFYVPQVNGVVGGRSILDGKKKKRNQQPLSAGQHRFSWLAWLASTAKYKKFNYKRL